MDSLVQYLISSFSLGGLYALMTLGLVVVYGILRLINFAYGELVMVAGYGLLLFGNTELAWPLVALFSILSAVIAAVIMERVAFRPVRFGSANTMLITSFAVSTLLQNVTLLAISPGRKRCGCPPFSWRALQSGTCGCGLWTWPASWSVCWPWSS